MKPIRIDLSEPGKFINLQIPHHSTGYVKIDRCQEWPSGRGEVLCSMRIKVEDLPRVFIEIMFECGITAKEIHAELFSRIHDIPAVELEYCFNK
jgi:hypothetical protein